MENHPPPVALLGDDTQTGAAQGRKRPLRKWATNTAGVYLFGQLSSDDLWVSVCRGEVGCVHGLSRPHVANVDAVLNAV